MVVDCMLRFTPVRTGTAVSVIVTSAVAVMVVPLRVEVTVNATIPLFDPAVKVVEGPVEGKTDPRVLLSVHAYEIPEGHGLEEHDAVAVNENVFPTWTIPDVGPIWTSVNTGVTVIDTGELRTVFPFSVAFTKRFTDPESFPAV